MKRLAMAIVVGLAVMMLLIAPERGISQANHRTPTDDTYVDLNDPDVNKDAGQLRTDYSTVPSYVVTRRVYLRYDLSAITGDVGDGTNLRIYVTGAPLFTTGSVAIYSAGDDWNGTAAGSGGETTLVWNNAPSLIAALNVTTANSASGGTWITFNSAALHSYINSQRSANGGDNIASFAVQWDSCTSCSLDDNIRFENRENTGGSGNPPELITFTPTNVTLQSIVAAPLSSDNSLLLVGGLLIAAVGGGLIFTRRRRHA